MWWPVGSLRCAWFALLLQVHIFGRRDPVLLLTCKALPGQSPKYITDPLTPYEPGRLLRWVKGDFLVVPRAKLVKNHHWCQNGPYYYYYEVLIEKGRDGMITITFVSSFFVILLSSHIISVLHCPLQTLYISTHLSSPSRTQTQTNTHLLYPFISNQKHILVFYQI